MMHTYNSPPSFLPLPPSFPSPSSPSRVITSIKGAPAEYGMEESKLKPFEKLLQALEGKLMEGHIFKVGVASWLVNKSTDSHCMHTYHICAHTPVSTHKLTYTLTHSHAHTTHTHTHTRTYTITTHTHALHTRTTRAHTRTHTHAHTHTHTHTRTHTHACTHTHTHAHTHTTHCNCTTSALHIPSATPLIILFFLLQSCVTQIFDSVEVNVTQNQLLRDEFNINLRNIFVHLESRIGGLRLALR